MNPGELKVAGDRAGRIFNNLPGGRAIMIPKNINTSLDRTADLTHTPKRGRWFSKRLV